MGPLITRKDMLLACRAFLPWRWSQLRRGPHLERAIERLRLITGRKQVYLIDSARSGLLLALRSLSLEPGDEIIVQAYTCMVVLNAIRHAGGVPVFVDIDERYNIDVTKIEEAITEKTRAIIVQHTFGVLADTRTILKITLERDIIIIEDSAHIIGVKDSGTPVGTVGDIGVFSFGSEKYISTARGGAVIINNQVLLDAFETEYKQLQPLEVMKILQHLMTFIVFPLGKWMYGSIGKGILAFAARLKITARIIYPHERVGRRGSWHPSTYPNALASILIAQLDSLENSIKHRHDLTMRYLSAFRKYGISTQAMDDGTAVMQFAIEVEDPFDLLAYLNTRGIMVSDSWTGSPIVPRNVNLCKTGYLESQAPIAEHVSGHHVALPTHPNVSVEDVEWIIREVINYYNKKSEGII